MIKYAKIINEETGLCEVSTGTNAEFYISIGMKQLDVQQSDIDNNWYLSEKCPMKTEDEKAKEERERINMLSLTAADVERAIYKAKGMDFEDIMKQLSSYEAGQLGGLDLKALKIELKANNFYRGNPYIEQVGALLGFTPLMLDEFFETGDYIKLLPIEEEVNADTTNTESDIPIQTPVEDSIPEEKITG